MRTRIKADPLALAGTEACPTGDFACFARDCGQGV